MLRILHHDDSIHTMSFGMTFIRYFWDVILGGILKPSLQCPGLDIAYDRAEDLKSESRDVM